jgi:glycosyltransferase involved in cell wall biosynthesis
MTVVAVTHGYPPFWNMGGEVALHRAMSVIKGDRAVLTKTEDDYTFEGVRVTKINTENVLDVYSDPVPIAMQLKSLDARVVIGQNELSLACVIAAKILGIVSIVNVHTPPKYGRGIREAVIQADYAVYNTRTSAEQWGEPNAVVLHPQIPPLPKEIKNNGDAYTCLSSLRNKGVEVMLALAEMYPDKRFIIVRSPAEPTHGLPDLEEKASRLPNVSLCPRVDPKDVHIYLEQTRILLVPSRYETYGMSAIEAAGYGIPSIHVDTPHVREGIGDAAILISPLNVQEAARAINAIESDYEAYSKKVRERAEWLQARQEEESEQFSNFISVVTKPQEGHLRQRSVFNATRRIR